MVVLAAAGLPAGVPWLAGGQAGAGTVTEGPAAGAEGTADAADLDPTGVCPPAPRDAHPATLRAMPVSVASDFGLDGWTLRSSTNVTVFRGPNELSTPYTPEVRHESSYGDPSGATVVLTVDRWADDGRAAEAATALAAERPTTLRWGRDTLGTVVYPPSAGGDTVTADARTPYRAGLTLLSHATTPDGRRLGRDCVSRLLVERNATAR